MNEKIDTLIKYLVSKNTTFTVGEINEISNLLISLKEKKEVAPEVAPVESPREEDGK